MIKQTLGVIMIVKNEEHSLPGILSDIKDIADEIMIVDTGSEDGTVSIAKSFGARIAEFPWINDFASARNFSIECASCDYLLWLDADDRIDEKDRSALTSLKTRLRPEHDRAYMLRILSCSHDMPETISYQTRIIPNKQGIRFDGKVHEQILPSLEKHGITIESSDIVIRHTGYHDKEARLAKGRRNLQILLDEYREGKDTATQCFFIAMASIAVNDYEQCLEYLRKAREKRTNEDWHQFSFAIATECLMKQDRIQDAYKESQRGLTFFKDSVLLHFFHGMSCLKAGHFEEAVSIFDKATKLPLQVSSYPIPPNILGKIWFHYGKALENLGRVQDAISCYKKALDSGYDNIPTYHTLGIALIQSGQIQEASTFLEKVRKDTDKVDIPIWMSLAKVYFYLKRYAEAQNIYSEILSESPTDKHALAGILETSIELDDTTSFFTALEQFVNILNIPVPMEINSLAECAQLCTEIGRHLKMNQDESLPRRLAEIALRLDISCAYAYILLADLAYSEKDVPAAIASLEKALKYGADPKEIFDRVTCIEQAGIST